MTGELHEVSVAIGELTGVTKALQVQVAKDEKSRKELHGTVDKLNTTLAGLDERVKVTEKGVSDYHRTKQRILYWVGGLSLGGGTLGSVAGRFWNNLTG